MESSSGQVRAIWKRGSGGRKIEKQTGCHRVEKQAGERGGAAGGLRPGSQRPAVPGASGLSGHFQGTDSPVPCPGAVAPATVPRFPETPMF